MAVDIKKLRADYYSPENKLMRALYSIVNQCKTDCSKYHHLGSSGFDNHLGYTSYDLKQYRKLLSKRLRTFLKDHKKEIDLLELREEVEKRINDAKAFRGETVYEIDPHARPGKNHHTGKPYY